MNSLFPAQKRIACTMITTSVFCTCGNIGQVTPKISYFYFEIDTHRVKASQNQFISFWKQITAHNVHAPAGSALRLNRNRSKRAELASVHRLSKLQKKILAVYLSLINVLLYSKRTYFSDDPTDESARHETTGSPDHTLWTFWQW